MKVTGPSAPSAAEIRKAAKKAAGGGDFAAHLKVEDGGGGAAAVGSVSAVDTLLALQEVGDDDENRRRGRLRGRAMLDLLDEIRHGLLAGAIPLDRLERLLAAVRLRHDMAGDAKLSEILQEIEVRASVELAKLGRL